MLVPERRRRRLQMDRHRVVNGRADAAIVKMPLQVIAAVRLDDERVEGVELDLAIGGQNTLSGSSDRR